MDKGMLLVISGFSGVGKGTVIRHLLSSHEGYALSVSATTRSPRPGEVHGEHYYFLSDEEFQRLIREDGFLEYAGYVEHFYGTPRSFVEEKLSSGQTVILEIEMQGAMKVKKSFPEATLIFIAPPSAEALKERLIGRDSADSPDLPKRLARAKEEAVYMNQYDFVLVNDQVEDCAERLHALALALKNKTSCQEEFIRKIQTQVEQM